MEEQPGDPETGQEGGGLPVTRQSHDREPREACERLRRTDAAMKDRESLSMARQQNLREMRTLVGQMRIFREAPCWTVKTRDQRGSTPFGRRVRAKARV